MINKIGAILLLTCLDANSAGSDGAGALGAEAAGSRDGFFSSIYTYKRGADQDRTDDLLNAIQALSQLSYGPKLYIFIP